MQPHITLSGSIFEGFSTRIQAERAWLLGNSLGAVRQLDAAGVARATPAAPYTEEAMLLFLGLSDDYLGTAWYVVSKGKRPGIYPCWYVFPLDRTQACFRNLAASQVLHVSKAIFDKYPSKAAAVAAFQLAEANHVVYTLP